MAGRARRERLSTHHGDGPGQPGSDAGLPRVYDPGVVENGIYERWLAADVFAPDGAGSRAHPGAPPFVIVQPPPNVTGALHLGHAFTADVEDVMVRHARMNGRPTLWLPGLDHASIAAQVVLDRILDREGETRASLGRERYLERMWAFVNTTRETILRQSRRFGSSLDWPRLRFTMDETSARAVRTAFTRLYDDGLAYRTEALANWCVGCQTTVSDLEVVPTPETGTLWTIRYHVLDEAGIVKTGQAIEIATTRPETLLGDVAVAVHPGDPRYAPMVGATVLIPFVERPVPVIADEAVRPEFGTGAVKITPAHDPDDFATGRRHDLPMINVFDDAGRINENGDGYAGLTLAEARRRILADLDSRGDLVAAVPHEMLIGRCQRSNDIIEPRLKTQWFIRTKPLAARALEATRRGQTRIVPERFDAVWEHWLTEIRDWNVSRQLWWGHRIPAWYCPDGHITVTADADGPGACTTCGRPRSELRQDEDIFDTWFSSGLWPMSTLGWPAETDDLARYYPGTVLETGYDIIFFWVARMMMLGIHFMDRPPFETVYLHGMVRDPIGKKMSKTTGNVVDPLEAIDTIGADALRFALINGVSPGNDQRLSQDKLDTARNFGNKLWNAARFVLGARPETIPHDAPRVAPDPRLLGPAERWIRSRTAATAAAVDRAFTDLALGEASRVLYEAIWSELCDWGLELAKVRLADRDLVADVREATWWTLVEALDTDLRLLHPFMPFLTEAIWTATPHAPGDPELLIVADWPGPEVAGWADAAAEVDVGSVIDLVRGVRNARSEARIEAAAWLPVDVVVAGGSGAALSDLRSAVERLARARPLRVHESRAAFDAATTVGGFTVIGPGFEAVVGRPAASAGAPAGADSAADRDRERLTRELASTRSLLEASRARLANEAFTSRAPAAVVAGARARDAELADQVRRLEERLRA
ncbi:MAG TPA: valine--tRNA ligase [Candidatus Limnocylindrales bacterium]